LSLQASELRAKLLRQLATLEDIYTRESTPKPEANSARRVADRIREKIGATQEEVTAASRVTAEEVRANFNEQHSGSYATQHQFDAHWLESATRRLGRQNARIGNFGYDDERRWKRLLYLIADANEEGWLDPENKSIWISVGNSIDRFLIEAAMVLNDYLNAIRKNTPIALPSNTVGIVRIDDKALSPTKQKTLEELTAAKVRTVENELAKRKNKPLPYIPPVDQFLTLEEGSALSLT
jgi:hypothetical protein